jgi:putative peptidoglycan lipid II flippase
VASEASGADDAAKEAAARRPFAVVRSLAGITMASRLLGFGRDVLMAAALGTGLVADAFFLAWALPNLARRLFGEGAFSAALVPVFVEAREQGDQDGARRLVSGTVTRLAVGLCLLVALLEAVCLGLGSAAGQELLTSAFGVTGAGLTKVTLALDLAQSLLPYLVFICLAGVLGGALNALDRFVIPAAAPIVLNVVWIAALLVGPLLAETELGRVQVLTWALVGGGVLQLLLHTGAMKKAECPVRPTWALDPERKRRIRALFFSLALGMALFQVNVLLDGVIAYSLVAEGGVSTLYYANRLVQLPVGVMGVALSTAVFPELARRAKRGDTQGMGEILDRGVILGAFAALPAAVGLVVLAEPIVALLFERGRFDAESSARTGWVLFLLAPAVVTACVTPVITRAFYAEEQVKTPVRVGAACVLLNLVLNLVLVGPMQEAGLAVATSVSQGLNLVLQAWLYRRRRQERGDELATGRVAATVARSAGLAAVMGGAAWGAHWACPGPDAVRVGLAIAVGVGVYAGLAWALKAPELKLLLARRR